MKHTQHSVGSKENAIAIYESGWWKGKSAREIAEFQLFTEELCCPFGVFHGAVEDVLSRPVWTHEFGLNLDGIISEFLGERPAPSFSDILNLIPEDKRLIITTA